MPHLEIKRTTKGITKKAHELRDELCERDAEFEECSSWSFSAIPLLQQVIPHFDEAGDPMGLLVWIVQAGKRYFLYGPSEQDKVVLMILNNGKFSGIGSDCLDLAKVISEIKPKTAKDLLSKAGKL